MGRQAQNAGLAFAAGAIFGAVGACAAAASFLLETGGGGRNGPTVEEALAAFRAPRVDPESVAALVDASSVQMCMAKLSPLQVFGWLLTADEAKLVSQWTEAEYEKGASTEVAPSAKAKAGSRKRSGQDALAKLEALMRD